MVDLTAVISLLKQAIPDLQAIYLFGSQASGHANAQSDVDLAVLADTPVSSLNRWEIAANCSILVQRDIDLVDVKTANTILQYQAVILGRRIYALNATYCDFYENLIMSQYLDLQMFRQPLINHIREQGSIYGR